MEGLTGWTLSISTKIYMKEIDIRPKEIFSTYRKLSKEDALNNFPSAARKKINCIACDSKKLEPQFKKHQFEYSMCLECGSLFHSPRADLNAFDDFYKNSKSSLFWATEFFPAVMDARRELVFAPKAREILSKIEKLNINTDKIADIGAGYGIFLEEWEKISNTKTLTAIEPSSEMADICRSKGFDVHESMIEDINEKINANLTVCFEVLEHAHNPFQFIMSLKNVMHANGYLLLTTLSVDGFDIQQLWSQSDQISPPHHINFLSIQGFELMFARAGFDIVEISTPGKLDVDIVMNSDYFPETELSSSKLFKQILLDESKRKSFQQYLSDNLMSSHIWVLAKLRN